MATQICPECKENAFFWSAGDDEYSLTQWGCWKCGYGACEDESRERVCLECGKKTECHMRDEEKEYWWCSSCNKTEVISD